MKFGRNYRCLITTASGESLLIENPLTCDFSITRNTMSSLNSMQLKFYNLSENTRNKLFQDRFNINKTIKIIFQAGYEELSAVFIGEVFMANSSRAGSDIVTFIDARDGGFDTVNTTSHMTIAKGETKDAVIKKLIQQFANLKAGTITEIDGEFRRGCVLNGNTFAILKKYTNDLVFIDLNKVNVVKDNEVVEGNVPLINSKTGLLGTPKKQNSYLEITTLFEPRIIMGQVIQIESSIQKEYDGQYKVIGVSHRGIISDAVNGDCKTVLHLLSGTKLFGDFTKI